MNIYEKDRAKERERETAHQSWTCALVLPYLLCEKNKNKEKKPTNTKQELSKVAADR